METVGNFRTDRMRAVQNMALDLGERITLPETQMTWAFQRYGRYITLRRLFKNQSSNYQRDIHNFKLTPHMGCGDGERIDTDRCSTDAHCVAFAAPSRLTGYRVMIDCSYRNVRRKQSARTYDANSLPAGIFVTYVDVNSTNSPGPSQGG